MKKSILLIVFLFCTTLFAFSQQNYKALISEGERLYKSKDYAKSNEMYLLAFKKERKDKMDLYNAGCSAALAGDHKNAFKFLNLSIDKGWTDITHIKNDIDLQTLRNQPQWNELIAKLEVKVGQVESNYNKEAKKTLEDVYKTDQGIRTQFINAQKSFEVNRDKIDSLRSLMIYHDSLNTIAVTEILDKYGWLGEDKVGNKGNMTLFLVIQHANLKTQQKYLPILRKAVKEGKASPSSLALLEDRIAMRTGKKQIYGSQLISVPDHPEKYYLYPMIDPDNLDKRRASVGLQPIADYIKGWDIVWDVEAYKKMAPQYEEWAKKLKW